jgi:hypothetical protein
MTKIKKSNKSNDELTDSIIRKWNEQGMFIRFINGDTLDCRVSNLERVSLQDAMNHIDDWKVDWATNCTP